MKAEASHPHPPRAKAALTAGDRFNTSTHGTRRVNGIAFA